MGTQPLFALQLFAFVRYFSCFLVATQYFELIAGSRGTVQSEYEDGSRGTGFFNARVPFVEHGLNPSELCSCQYDVACVQCAVFYQYGGNITATLVECRFDDRTRSSTIGIGFQVK